MLLAERRTASGVIRQADNDSSTQVNLEDGGKKTKRGISTVGYAAAPLKFPLSFVRSIAKQSSVMMSPQEYVKAARRTVVVEELFNQIDMCENHTPTAVSL
jgi:hypothetical protein